MKRFFATLTLALALVMPALALNNYTSPKGDFAIQSPATFVVEDRSTGTNETRTLYTAEEGNGNVLMVETATPIAVDPAKFDAFAQSFAAAIDGKIFAQDVLPNGNLYIIDFEQGRVALLLASRGNEMYEVAFVAPNSLIQSDIDEVTAIITSFTTAGPVVSQN